MTVHRVKMCPCGHEEAFHPDGGPCTYGHGHVMGGCTCPKFSRRKRRAAVVELMPATSHVRIELLGAIDETIHALRRLRVELGRADAPKPTSSPPTPKTHRLSSPEQIGRRTADANSRLGRCERAILTVLAQHGPRTKSQIAILSGYSSKSGGFRNALSTLRTADFIVDADGRVAITSSGRAALGKVEKLPSGSELLEYWKQNAGGLCERTILDVLAEVYPSRMPKESIARATARFREDGQPYSASSGGFRNALSRLRTLELVNGKSELALAPTLAEAS